MLLTSCNNYVKNYHELRTEYHDEYYSTVLFEENSSKINKKANSILDVTGEYVQRHYEKDNMLIEIYSYKNVNDPDDINCLRINNIKNYYIRKFKIPNDRIHSFIAKPTKAKVKDQNFGLVTVMAKNVDMNIYNIGVPNDQLGFYLVDTVKVKCN